MTIIQRIQSPTPPFFKAVRAIGMILAGVSASLLAAPIALPAAIVQIAGYLAVAGSVATAVSQTVTADKSKEPNTANDGN